MRFRSAIFGVPYRMAAAAKYIEPLKFIMDIMELPMFIVSGHACLCPLSGPCKPDASPLFTLPEDTYMMSWVAPEEIFCDINSEEMIYKNRFQLLQYLYHHSQSDILRGPKVKHSFFDGLKRAVGGTVDGTRMEYPNARFLFNPSPYVEPEQNPFGVYRIDKGTPVLNNSASIIKQTTGGTDDQWFLKDIMEECFRKEGVSRGVFILSGCFTRCNEDTPQSEIRRLETHFALLDTYYNSLKPTLTAKEMNTKIMRQFRLKEVAGIGHRQARVNIQEILETMPDFDPEEFLEEVHPSNVPELLRGISEYRTKQIREAFASAVPATGPRAQKAPRKPAFPKTMKQRIQHSKSVTRSKSRARLLERVKRATGRLPAWATNWLKRYTR